MICFFQSDFSGSKGSKDSGSAPDQDLGKSYEADHQDHGDHSGGDHGGSD